MATLTDVLKKAQQNTGKVNTSTQEKRLTATEKAQQARDQATATALQKSTTIDRFTPTTQAEQQAQADINVKYGLSPDTGLKGVETDQVTAMNQQAKNNVQPVVTQAPLQPPKPTGDTSTDSAAYDAYKTQLNAQKKAEADKLAKEEQAKPAMVESAQQAQETIQTTGLPEQYTSEQEFADSDPNGYNQWKQSSSDMQPYKSYEEAISQQNTPLPQVTPQITAPPQTPEQTIGVQPRSSLPEVPYVPTQSDNLRNILSEEQNVSLGDQMQTINSLPPETSGAALLKKSLLMKLGAIEDPSIIQMLDSQEKDATNAYKSGLAMVQVSMDEIDKAIDGTLEAPSTMEGLTAKIYQEGKAEQQANIANEIDYLQKQHDMQMTELRENRANLEGYAKAKLVSMGALDSSTGITVLGKMAASADMQIQRANLDYDHSHKQLILESNKIVKDYTNNVAGLVMKTNSQKSELAQTYNESIKQINNQKFTSESQKRKDKLTALADYADQMQKYEQESKKQQFEQMKFAYEQHQDAVKNAFDLSGMSGTIYIPDGQGGYKDTGMPTLTAANSLRDFSLNQMKFGLEQDKFALDKEQFNKTYALDIQRNQLLAQTERRNQAKQLIDLAAETNISPQMKNQLEMMMGFTKGSLNSMNTKEEINTYIDQQADKAQSQLPNVDPNVPVDQIPQEIQDLFRVGQVGDWCGVYAGSVCTAPNVGDTWQQKIDTVKKYGSIQDSPQPGYKLLLPLGVKTADKDYGHVLAVIGYDPKTNGVICAQSNGDGRQNRGAGKGVVSLVGYNLDALKSKYGSNWGFVPGELKPEIKQKLLTLNAQQGQVDIGTSVQRTSQEGAFEGFIDFMSYPTATNKKADQVAFQQENTIRDEFTKNTQNFVKIRDSYNTIQSAAKDPTAAGDLSLIFAYMKILDPGSTVREGEFANAQNSGSIPTQIQNIWNKAQTGERLSSQQRTDFLSQANKLYSSQKNSYDRQVENTKKLAESYGLDPNRVVYDFANPELASTGGGSINSQPISIGNTANQAGVLDYYGDYSIGNTNPNHIISFNNL